MDTLPDNLDDLLRDPEPQPLTIPVTSFAEEKPLQNSGARGYALTSTGALGEALTPLPPTYRHEVANTPPHPLQPWLGHIERMSAQGMQPAQIAARLGCPADSFEQAITHYPDIAAALRGGHARGVDEMSASLYRAGLWGDTAAARFRLSTVPGFTVPKNQGPAVVVNVGQQQAPVTIDHVDSIAEQQWRMLAPVQAESPSTE